MSETTPKIYKTIMAVMKDIGFIAKDDKNTFQKYEFRGIDAVFDKMYPIFCEHGLFVYPEVIKVERHENIVDIKEGKKVIGSSQKGFYTVLTIKYTFVCVEDGSTFECVVVGEASDTSDKSCNKAMSAAFKYLLFQVFCIPVKGTPDADKDSPDIPKTKEVSKAQNETDGGLTVGQLFRGTLRRN